MQICLTYSQLPELKVMAPNLRRFVFHRALGLMRLRAKSFCWLPTLLCCSGGLAGGFVGSTLLGHFYSNLVLAQDGRFFASALWSLLGAGLGSFLGGFIGRQLQFWKLRPYIHRAITEYGFDAS